MQKAGRNTRKENLSVFWELDMTFLYLNACVFNRILNTICQALWFNCQRRA
jgi:hypothetical protein